MEAALEAKRAGTVRHIGVSSHSLEVALQMVPSGHFETIQFPFNFVTREPADELLPLAQAHDVGFIAMKPFAGGLLDDATLSVKYLLQFEGVVPDPGIERVDEMREIVGILAGEWALTAEEGQEIERVYTSYLPGPEQPDSAHLVGQTQRAAGDAAMSVAKESRLVP